MIPLRIPRDHMTGECWTVQFEGLAACINCEYQNSEDCGGPDIRSTGKNSKGYPVPLERALV